jgi:hypothetical protein
MSEEIYEERFTKDSKILIDIREIAERFGYSRDSEDSIHKYMI